MELKNWGSWWVKYDKYEYKKDENKNLYITPALNAKPKPYDPMKISEQLVLDFLNVGMLLMKRAEEAEVKKSVLDFVTNYGLLGFITALPTTPEFVNYNAVYLPKNHFIKEETMTTEDYLDIFFPFEKLDFVKRGKESVWNMNENNKTTALGLTFSDHPTAVIMGFGRNYAERFDWLCTQFKDLAFSLVTPFLYYNDYADLDETERDLYREGMRAFGGISPTYRVVLEENPTLVWNFYSLLSCVQMMFTFMLTDENHPLRPCKNCMRAFIPARSNTAFCSSDCKNKYKCSGLT